MFHLLGLKWDFAQVMLARCLRLPLVAIGQGDGTGIGFLQRYPHRAREYSARMREGLSAALAPLSAGDGELPSVPPPRAASAAVGAEDDGEEEEFGDPRAWAELSPEEQRRDQEMFPGLRQAHLCGRQ